MQFFLFGTKTHVSVIGKLGVWRVISSYMTYIRKPHKYCQMKYALCSFCMTGSNTVPWSVLYISWTNFEIEHIHECSHFMNDGIWEDMKPKGWIIFVSKVAHALKSWILIWVGMGVPLHMKRPWVFPYLPIQLVSKGNRLNSETMGFIYLYHN